MNRIFAAALCLGALPAAAASVSLGGTATAASGLVSSRAGVDLPISFDDGPGGTCGEPFGINILGNPKQGDVRIDMNEIAGVRLRPDVDNSHTASTNNTSCYLSVGRGANLVTGVSSITGELFIEIPTFLAFKYIGFYWGSIDPYNEIVFFDAVTGGNRIPVAGFGTDVFGDEIAASLGVPLYSSAFVNFDFSVGQIVRRIELRSNFNTAFELDNIGLISGLPTIRTDRALLRAASPAVTPLAVPEASTFALFLTLGLATLRRRR